MAWPLGIVKLAPAATIALQTSPKTIWHLGDGALATALEVRGARDRAVIPSGPSGSL
jgi:hypothetical protein